MNASEITFTSEISVRMIQQCGGDHMVVGAARTSTTGSDALKYADSGMAEESAGLINYLVKQRHGTPTEHGILTLTVHAPAFVWWEWVRHRVGMTVDCPDMSFSLESGRYRQLEPVFWVPRPDRKMTPAAGYKPSRPKFVEVDATRHQSVVYRMRRAYEAAWDQYRAMIDDGIANEVARPVLGFGVYYSGWITCNPRSLMSFLSLRTHDAGAKFVSFPQAEIEEAARAAEEIFVRFWPVTHEAFCRNGRVGP
jgi:thymidylate synthase (FAD)